MKVAYESPISLLEELAKFSDYQCCLAHLLFVHEAYEDWFVRKFRQLQPSGEIILNNYGSQTYDMDQYVKRINRVKPNYYVLHDKPNDKYATMAFAEKFLQTYVDDLPPECDPIGVLQGSTWEELKECYVWMDGYVDYIAIPCYLKYFGDDFMTGRVRLIHNLEDAKIWNKNNKHHLLEAKNAAEFQHYEYNDLNIVSLNTSRPVSLGMNGLAFDSSEKLKGWRLIDHMEDEISEEQRKLILNNTEQFTKIVKQQYYSE